MSAVADIGSWFATVTMLEMFYVVSAALGGLVFLIRIVLMFFIGDSDGALDGFDAGGLGGDADASFQLLSIQGLSGFFVMFGLVGVALLRADFSEFGSVVGAVIAGGATMMAVAQLSRLMLRLQSSGNIEIASAVGSEGTVYLTIPADGVGRAQVIVQSRLRTYDAISRTQAALTTGTPVRVVEVRGGTLVVEKL